MVATQYPQASQRELLQIQQFDFADEQQAQQAFDAMQSHIDLQSIYPTQLPTGENLPPFTNGELWILKQVGRAILLLMFGPIILRFIP